jgi:hypothetical protein
VIGTNASPRPSAISGGGEQVGEVAGVDGHLGEPEQPAGEQRQPADEHLAESQAGEERGGQSGGDDDPDGQRQLGKPGGDRA